MKAQIIGNFHLILDLTTNDVKIKRMKTIVGKLILMSNLPPLRDRQRRQKCESSNGNSILVMRIVTNFGWLTVDKNNGTKRYNVAVSISLFVCVCVTKWTGPYVSTTEMDSYNKTKLKYFFSFFLSSFHLVLFATQKQTHMASVEYDKSRLKIKQLKL